MPLGSSSLLGFKKPETIRPRFIKLFYFFAPLRVLPSSEPWLLERECLAMVLAPGDVQVPLTGLETMKWRH